jgi:hypothetical protein
MAQSDKSQPTRKLSDLIGMRNPDNDAVIQEIAGQPVMITAATSEQRQGKRRKYWVTNVTLADGRTFTVVGKAVAEPLSYLEPKDYPIEVVFTSEPSEFEPGAYYWAVN